MTIMIKPLIDLLNNLHEKETATILLNTLSNYATSIEQLDELSHCYFKLKKYEPAIILSELALKKTESIEQEYPISSNLINLYNHANYPERAMELIEKLERIKPTDIDITLEKAFSLFLLNRKPEAEALLLKHVDNDALSLDSKTKIRFNLGTYKLYRDEFIEGLRLFLTEGQKLKFWRTQTAPLIQYKFWDGGSFPGKYLILNSEAGIGDEIISIRFMKHLAERTGMIPIWYTDRKDVANIFNNNGFKTITDKKKLPTSGYWTFPMSVPLYLNLTYEDLWDGPYLKSSIDFDKKYDWMNNSKLKIGLRWEGNPDYDQDLHRTIPLYDTYNAIKDIDAEFYSLQRDTGLDELLQFPEIKDMSTYMNTFEETMAIINNLDIIITSCTSIAHISAAMGKRTIVLVPISAYYVWSHSMEQSPWYGDNVTILRQELPRNWEKPIGELKRLLKTEIAR